MYSYLTDDDNADKTSKDTLTCVIKLELKLED